VKRKKKIEKYENNLIIDQNCELEINKINSEINNIKKDFIRIFKSLLDLKITKIFLNDILIKNIENNNKNGKLI